MQLDGELSAGASMSQVLEALRRPGRGNAADPEEDEPAPKKTKTGGGRSSTAGSSKAPPQQPASSSASGGAGGPSGDLALQPTAGGKKKLTQAGLLSKAVQLYFKLLDHRSLLQGHGTATAASQLEDFKATLAAGKAVKEELDSDLVPETEFKRLADKLAGLEEALKSFKKLKLPPKPS